jgi:hypothetical protein
MEFTQDGNEGQGVGSRFYAKFLISIQAFIASPNVHPPLVVLNLHKGCCLR